MQQSNEMAAKRSRKQYSCTECQRRKQRCVFRRLDVPCTNCSKRFPPVDCIRSGAAHTREPVGHLEHEKIFDLESWQEVATEHPGALKTPIVLHPATLAHMPLEKHKNPRSQESLGPASSFVIEKGRVQRSSDTEKESRIEDIAKSRSSLSLAGREGFAPPKWIGGIVTEVTTLNGFPLEPSAREAELLHFYLRFVAPNLVSIDGEGQPAVFLQEVLPWQLQSPLMPNIGILMASATQALDKGIAMAENPESLLVKARVLSYINRFLNVAESETFHLIASEALKSVVNLVVMEWFWGTEESMQAHSRGIREMLRLRGGMKELHDPVLEAILVLTDYEIACCFEQSLQWQDANHVEDNMNITPTSWPVALDSPLIGANSSIDYSRLHLSVETVSILDNVRFITTSITSPTTSSNETSKIQATAAWFCNKLEGMPALELEKDASEAEFIEETIRLAALIYTWSIKSLSPISQYPNAPILTRLYTSTMKVSLTTWKKTLGIFFWVMLVQCPNTRNDQRGKFARRKMAVAGLSIGFEDFPLGISYLRAFWLVQQWIFRNGRVV